MLTWIFQQIIISLVVIILIHSIYKFLQLNLTTPKVRDLVNKPTKQYEEIYNTFKNTKKDEQNNNSSMKSELQNYLKELSVNQETNIKSINNNDNNDNNDNNEKLPQSMGELQSGTFSDNFSPAYQTL